MDEYIRQALEIVKAQAGFRSMSEEEISSMIRSLSGTIQQLSPEAQPAQVPAVSLEKSLGDKAIICMECGKNFKIITKKHLALHGLTPEEYKDKWGYPRNTPLICKNLQKERRKKMRSMKLWEKRRKTTTA